MNIQGFPLNYVPKALDAAQGELGDCYLISALSAITEHKEIRDSLLLKANPNNSLYVVKLYCGGKSVLVPVDDTFPYTGEDFAFAGRGHLSDISHHLWAMLIEKAYAKLHGITYNQL